MSNLPVKTATVDLAGRPKYLEPAPFLRGGMCSDCCVPMTGAGENDGNGTDLKVCPKCYALLWHRDFRTEAVRLRREQEERERLRLEQLRAAKAEMKERPRQGSHQLVSHQAEQMMLRRARQRLVELALARAWMLYSEMC